MSDSGTLRITSGFLNTVNDVWPPPIGSFRAAGQLGKYADFESSNVIFSPTVGTLYGGRFQYVRLSPASTAVVVGQILFWDTVAAANLFQVTADEALSSVPDSIMIAGINLNPAWTPGNAGLIQILGNVAVKFITPLTVAGALGSTVYASTVGGASRGFADVLATDATAPVNARFLGKAVVAPTNGGLTVVSLVPQVQMF